MNFWNQSTTTKIDWWLVIGYIVLVFIGWMNIYSSIHAAESYSLFDLGGRSGKQFIWMIASFIVAALILFVVNPRAYEGLSLPFYALVILLLIAVIFVGGDIKGSKSWFELGPLRFQPAEISKITTSLMLARVMSQYGFKLSRPKHFIAAAAIILVPMAIIVLENETGSALVYVGFIFVLYREGLSGWIIFMIGMAILSFVLTLVISPYAAVMALLVVAAVYILLCTDSKRSWWLHYFPAIVVLAALPFLFDKLCTLTDNPDAFIRKIDPLYILLGICAIAIPPILVSAYRKQKPYVFIVAISFIAGVLLVYSTDIIFDNVLQDHQRSRIEVLLGLKEDPAGVGYNVNQSMIAIGSGGLTGKGYLNGTQTTFGFVPEQSTDFIFCTVGEEWGFLGATAVILIYVLMIGRIIISAEHSQEAFTRIYGYCVAACFFMHLGINIGMTIGIMPVIGIPLPFLSYGGSSLLSFTILLFIFIALKRNESRR